jgi:CDP-6-deoxy-D-xylo-4-hexulose-3-dehydrase
MMMSAAALRAEISKLVGAYAETALAPKPFVPGQSVIPPSGKVIGAPELQTMVEAVLDGWLTTGRFNTEFEKRLAQFIGVPFLLTTTSGSSANLLALTALTSPKLGDRRLTPGDEVITVATGFPTTVNPTIQNGLVPVFVDAHIPTYNIDPDLIEAAISPRSRAIMVAHTLGNPFDLHKVREIADKYDLWLIEDCCDALGATYDNRNVGTFGDIGTLSFYPAHHITMGEGGAVFTNSPELKTIIESFRDWGRDCYCAPGCDNTCGKRFGQKFGELPDGYDHKYVYSHIGYNLKITDMQAACGLAQLDRVEGFIEARRKNFAFLTERFTTLTEQLVLPEATPNSNPSWFGYPITLRSEAGVRREDLLKFLDQKKVGTRLLFAGNLIRQPYFQSVNYRLSGSLESSDRIMRDTFWIGLYPGLGEEHLDYAVTTIEEFLGVGF